MSNQKSMRDQMGREVDVPNSPQRIVSLVPSQTELLYYLGLEERVVGITKFCVHPRRWRKQKTVVGGTKQFNFEVIESLSPDLIIGNKEENYQEGIEQLAAKYPVWMSDIFNLNDALDMIEKVGGLVGKKQKAQELRDSIQERFFLPNIPAPQRALYLIWKNPYMAAGKQTFIDNMLRYAGYENAMGQYRYPQLTLSEIESIHPQVILLSSEPYPFKEKHVAELKAVLPKAEVKLVDGEMFSWYGSRLLKAADYFTRLKET